MIVVCIIAVLVGLSLPHFSFLRSLQLTTELQKLSTFFTYVQQRAIASGIQQELLFDQTKKTYGINGRYQQLPDGIEFGVISGALGPPSNPIVPITAAISFTNQKVVFLPDGTLQSGAVYLIDRDKKYMAALTTPIGDVSHLRMYTYNNGWKLLE
jgi:hypothetical protein